MATFSDTFGGSGSLSATGWSLTGFNGSISQGSGVATIISHSHATRDPLDGAAQQAEVTFTRSDPGDELMVQVCGSGTMSQWWCPDGYVAHIKFGTYAEVYRNGSSIIAQTDYGGSAIPATGPVTVGIRNDGGLIELIVNGVVLASTTDGSPLASKNVGFGCPSLVSSSVAADNFAAEDLGGPAPTVLLNVGGPVLAVAPGVRLSV